MKKGLFIVLCFLVTMSCQRHNPKIVHTLPYGLSMIRSVDLVDSLRSYIKKNLKEKKGVIVVHFRLNGDTSIFYISSNLDRDPIRKNPPGHFSIENGVPILFYTGLESNLELDSLYLSKFYESIDPVLEDYIEDKEGKILQIPPNYNPQVWKLELVSGKIIKSEIVN